MSRPIRTPGWRHLCRKRNDLLGTPHPINRFLIESIRRGRSKGFCPGRCFWRVLLFPGSGRTNPRDGLSLQDSQGTGWGWSWCSEAGTHLSRPLGLEFYSRAWDSFIFHYTMYKLHFVKTITLEDNCKH